ncbi:MAG TPA: hypothetical protein DEG47_28310, partial [Cyanobacteria bacterium UBA11148]|nr:hypothetical protein [Cyanobacteria bacterium UBA11148]
KEDKEDKRDKRDKEDKGDKGEGNYYQDLRNCHKRSRNSAAQLRLNLIAGIYNYELCLTEIC